AVPRCRAETRVCPARAAQPEALPAGRPAFSCRPPGQSARRAGATALPCVQRPGPGCDDAAGATKSRGGGMRKLRIVGVEADSSVVECEVPASGEKFTLPLDDRFRAAARGEYLASDAAERRPVTGTLRPREIQDRIRHGATAEEVATDAGVPLSGIEGFAVPVLLERASAADLAKNAHPMLHDGPALNTLAERVGAALDRRGVDPDLATWDAWRDRSGGWVVRTSWPAGLSDDASATWSFVPDSPRLRLRAARSRRPWRRCRTTPITPRPTTSPPPRPWPGPTSVTTAPPTAPRPTAPRPTAPQTTSAPPTTAPPTPRPVTTTRTSSSTRRPRPSDARAAATRPCRRGRTSSSGSAARTTDPHHGHSRRDVLVPGHGRPVRPHPRRQPVGSGLRAPAALATVPHRHGGLTRRLPAQPLGVRRGRRDLRGLVPRRDRGADPRGRCRLALHDRGTLAPP